MLSHANQGTVRSEKFPIASRSVQTPANAALTEVHRSEIIMWTGIGMGVVLPIFVRVTVAPSNGRQAVRTLFTQPILPPDVKGSFLPQPKESFNSPIRS